MNIMKTFLALACLVVLGAMPSTATAQSGQGWPTTQTVLTTSTSAVAANTTATVTSQSFSVNPITGFSVTPSFALSGTGTSNVTFNFQVSLDGTTWSTTTPYTYAVAATGTTTVVGFYNFAPGIAATGATNVAYVRLGSVTNANTPSTLTINSITITKSNR